MNVRVLLTGSVLFGAAVALTGCASSSRSGEVTQLSFASPEDAVAALTYLAETRDREYGKQVFGPEADELSSGDPEVDEYEKALFAAAVRRRTELRSNGDGTVDILVGEKAVPFPVPLVEYAGRWLFDSPAGVDRMTDIRVGFHELKTIEALRAIALAQRQYREMDRDGDGVHEYAARIRSTEGKRDGLYWPTGPDEPNAPLGQFYTLGVAPYSETLGYQGYFYKLLDRAGPNAPGGARTFRDRASNLVEGYAVLAYPAVYGETAIMTFMMGEDGVIFERDLGPARTRTAAKDITAFDPGPGWTVVDDESLADAAAVSGAMPGSVFSLAD